jgi:hypothetical protein
VAGTPNAALLHECGASESGDCDENEIGHRYSASIGVCMLLLATSFCGKTVVAQDTSVVFSRLRQLPDLGACPSDPSQADPDLKKALTSAVTHAKDQATVMADSAERMRDAGLLKPETAKQLQESTQELQAALSDPDVCTAARAFAQLSPSPAVQTTIAQAPAAAMPDGTCKFGALPCIYQPYEGQTSVKGKLKLDAGTKVSDNTTAVLNIGDQPVSVEKYSPDTGEFEQAVNAMSVYNKVELVQKSASNAAISSGLIAVEKTAGQPDKISISTDVLDFGHQSMQTASDPKPVTVTSSSDDKLSLQLLTSRGQSRNFQVTGCQNSIDKGQQCTFNVTFAPFSPKLQEKYLAVVPVVATGSFEELRKDLNNKEVRAAAAEELWRVLARCADEDFLARDLDCPKTLGVKDDKNEDVYKLDKAETDRVLEQTERKQNKDVVKLAAQKIARAQFGKYQDTRNARDQAEQRLRAQFKVVTLNAVPDHWKFPFTRAVVGVDMSAPTSNTLKQSYFVDFNLLAPLKLPILKKNEDPLENRSWVWLNPRITSLPQATNFSAVSTINETGSFFDTTGKLNDIANGLDVNGGFELALIKPRDGIPWWGEYVNTQARLSPSLILGVGVSTPFSTSSTEVSSSVTQAICDAFKAPADRTVSDANGLICGVQDGKAAIKVTPNPDIPEDTGLRNFIDFFTPDRSRFFRRYYAGLRLKTYFFSRDVHSYCKPFESRPGDEGNCAAPYDIFPGIIDLTFGKDEAVTAGRLSG